VFKKKSSSIAIVVAALILGTFNNAYADVKKLEIIDKKAYSKILDNLEISNKDLSIYKELFAAVEEERWDKEEKRRGKIENDILLGHVLAQKYMSRSYDSSYEELLEWLEKYNDYPQYSKIYRLAVIKGSSEELQESLSYSNAIPEGTPGYNWNFEYFSNLSKENQKYVLNLVKKFRGYINSGKSKSAKYILENPKFRKLVPNRTWDSMAATLTTLYFTDNYDKLALEWSAKPRRRSNDVTAIWFGGLAAWRLGDYKKSAELFDKLARLDINDDWMMSAGGYWAYRAYMKLNKPALAKDALEEAAKHKRTFYGILANYKLGIKCDYNWDFYSFSADFSNYEYINHILASPALQRAVLLASIGQDRLAADEIYKEYKSLDNIQKEITMFIAEQYEMHGVAIHISNNLKDDDNDIYYDCITYPVPDWDSGVWQSDQALVLALVKQESVFHPKAVSKSGALGLMQIMPNTALYISNDKNIKQNAAALFDTEYNLGIGQKYVNYLFEKPYIEGNLFYMMTAYNAGPGNLLKWKKKTRYKNDPLMYIEAIPSRETRIYIERVMANYWMYGFRLGKKMPSLEQLSKDEWPTL
jgi:hypothetical protein